VIIIDFNQLDTISEGLLTLFHEHRALAMNQISLLTNLQLEQFSDHMHILLDKDYIENTCIDKCNDKNVYASGSYKITLHGDIYFDLRHKHNQDQRKDFILRISPIIISIIALIFSGISLANTLHLINIAP
jgi:hypothetical protein